MAGSDSIEFFAKYKEWLSIKKIEVDSNTTNFDVASCLSGIRGSAGRKAFEVLGIDITSLIPYSDKITEHLNAGIPSLIEAYQRMSSAEAKDGIKKACKGNEEMVPFAQAFLFKSVLNNLDIISVGMKTAEERNEDKEYGKGKKTAGKASFNTDAGDARKLPDGINFFAKYKNWVAIKKMLIRPDTKPEEVAMQLISIRISTDKKIFEIAGVNAGILDEYAAKKTSGMRRSFANLSKVIDIMNSKESQEKIKESVKPNEFDINLPAALSHTYAVKSMGDLAKEYLFKQLMQNIKFDFEVSPDKLAAMYPGLKLPGRRGRKPKA